jgi:hypothetical protein
MEAVMTLHIHAEEGKAVVQYQLSGKYCASLSVTHSTQFERPKSLHSRAATLQKNLKVFSYVHGFMFRVCVVARKALLRATRFPPFAVFFKNVTTANARICSLDKHLRNEFSRLLNKVRREWN